MFDQTSRYANIENNTIQKGGSILTYKKRRFLPQGDKIPLLIQVAVVPDDRIDLVTSRTLGFPEQYWRICDKNNIMYPIDLTTKPGHKLKIPVPGRR
jgi:hypothetical protein